MLRSMILPILLLINLQFLPVECVRTKTIDYDALEKAWEAGDDEHTEGDEHYRKLVDRNEGPKSLGPQMVFVTLKSGLIEPLSDVASRWKEMLWNGGVEVNIYQVDDSKLLVGLQKGVFANEVMMFLDKQQDVKEYEWNKKAYPSESHRHEQLKTGMNKIKRRNVKRLGSKLNKASNGKKMRHRRKSTDSAKTVKKHLEDEL